ncbi:MAG: hypothetical protein AAF081_01190 [Actinomycetota bacterium]
MREALRLAGFLAALVAAVLWALLAARTPTNTYHFAPLIVAGAWPAIDGSLGAGLTQRRSVNAALGGFAVAVATAVILAIKGDLDGPTLWETDGTTAVLVEHLVFAALGAVAGCVYAVHTAATEPRNV